MMNRELRNKWIEALRSGEYKQGQNMLVVAEEGVEKHCCLGVLCKVLGLPDARIGRYATLLAFQDGFESDNLDIGLPRDEREYLANMNDDGHTFWQIADYVEKNL